MTRACSSCGGPVTRHSRTGKCRDCSVNTPRRAEIMALHDQGMSLTDIGRRIGITKQAIAATLRRAEALPTEETIRACAMRIQALDALSRTRSLTNEESRDLERAIGLERRYSRKTNAAARYKRRWTPAEDALALAARDASARSAVAVQIGRTACAVATRRSLLTQAGMGG